MSPPRAEDFLAVDPLDVRDGELLPRLVVQDDELVGGDGRVGQEVHARIDRGGVDSEVPEQGRRGDVEIRSPGPPLGVDLPRETDGDEGPVAFFDDGRLAGLEGLPKRDHGRLSESCGELADARGTPRELGGCLDRERDELRALRWTRVHPDLAVGQVGEPGGRSLVLLLLRGCRGCDDRRGDAEGEGDGGECRAGTGLVAGEVSQRQARGDGGVPGRPGKEADRQWTQEQSAEDHCHEPGDDERRAVPV